jgi:catechol 2,3-dioxygenase-like lactoylglutathione lyase family enzyme
MFKKIDHVEIVTNDLDRTVDFYTNVLGFNTKLTQRIDPSSLGVPINIVYLELGGSAVELIWYEGAAIAAAPTGALPKNSQMRVNLIRLERKTYNK